MLFYFVRSALVTHIYIDALSSKEKESIVYFSSNRWYRFGVGNKTKATKNVLLPLHIGNVKTDIRVDIIDADIPLLFFKIITC